MRLDLAGQRGPQTLGCDNITVLNDQYVVHFRASFSHAVIVQEGLKRSASKLHVAIFLRI